MHAVAPFPIPKTSRLSIVGVRTQKQLGPALPRYHVTLGLHVTWGGQPESGDTREVVEGEPKTLHAGCQNGGPTNLSGFAGVFPNQGQS